MPKPSNKDLLAERKAIAELLADFEGSTNLSKVNDVLRKLEAQRVALDAMQGLKERLAAMGAPPVAAIPMPTPSQTAPALTPPPELSGPPTSSAPLDAAYYPRQGEVVAERRMPSTEGPPMSAVLGDMTPGYPEWHLRTHGTEPTRRKYGERMHLLPAEVRGALG